MKTYDFRLDIKRILAIFDLTVSELAEETNISRVTLTDILNGKITTFSNDLLEKVYSFAYQKEDGADLNRVKELLYLDDAQNQTLLFHGAKSEIKGELDLTHSVPPNDFGDGFYTGTSLKQAASWITGFPESSVYCFYLNNIDSLNIVLFESNREWLFAVLYFRNAFRHFMPNAEVNKIIKKINSADLVIAPIADNEMYKTIDAFARNEITDEACLHAISASNLGYQYVFKSDKALKNLECLERLYLCNKERDHYLKEKEVLSKEGIQKSQLAKIEYRRKGYYFDEIFKKK